MFKEQEYSLSWLQAGVLNSQTVDIHGNRLSPGLVPLSPHLSLWEEQPQPMKKLIVGLLQGLEQLGMWEEQGEGREPGEGGSKEETGKKSEPRIGHAQVSNTWQSQVAQWNS